MEIDPAIYPGRYGFLDLSGYIVSGKQAYSDLVREFEGYLVPAPEREFELIRIQGGIRDLENALVYDWSPIRADAAIRKFRTLIRRFGYKNNYLYPASWFAAAGWNYDEYFKGRFFELAEEYIKSLSIASWRTNLPYPLVDFCDHELFLRKILSLFGVKTAMDADITLAGPEGFLEKTRNFLECLLATRADSSTRVIVTHNAFEPFNPFRALRYFTRSKCIVVERDPRDSFAAMAPHRHLALGVRDFIDRFKLYRSQVRHENADENLVLRTRFEDLVLDYDATVRRVLDFLGEDGAIHRKKKEYFSPQVSLKNVGIWKTYSNQIDIERISCDLREYCDTRVD